MDELLAVLHIGESVAVSVLIWRSWVADRERSELMRLVRENGEWLRSLVKELLRTTDLRD